MERRDWRKRPVYGDILTESFAGGFAPALFDVLEVGAGSVMGGLDTGSFESPAIVVYWTYIPEKMFWGSPGRVRTVYDLLLAPMAGCIVTEAVLAAVVIERCTLRVEGKLWKRRRMRGYKIARRRG